MPRYAFEFEGAKGGDPIIKSFAEGTSEVWLAMRDIDAPPHAEIYITPIVFTGGVPPLDAALVMIGNAVNASLRFAEENAAALA